MDTSLLEHGTYLDSQAFLAAKRATTSAGTVDFYTRKLEPFVEWVAPQVEDTQAITSQHVRAFLSHLSEEHTPGGVHAHFRTLKAFVRWCIAEYDWQSWNPLRNVQAPKPQHVSMLASSVDSIRKVLQTCDARTFTGCRDAALLRMLFDSGLRASEVLRLDTLDFSLTEGTVNVPAAKTKSKVGRIVFVGSATQVAMHKYLLRRKRRAKDDSLWVTSSGRRLTYGGMHTILARRSAAASLEVPLSPHTVRKAFATELHRSGTSLEAIRRLLGHSSILVTQTYLMLSTEDVRKEYALHSPGDRLL